MTRIQQISISSTFSELKAPFTTALRTVSTLELFECVLITSDGRKGRGACVETPAITGDTKAQILEDLHVTLSAFLKGRSYSTYEDIALDLSNIHATSSAKAAVDMALYDLEFPNHSAHVKIKTDITVPIASVNEYEQIIKVRQLEGFEVFKVKMRSEEIDLSIEKLKSISSLIGPTGLIRIDPNQSWSVAHTLKFLDRLEGQGISIEFLEQPTLAKEKQWLAEIRKRSNIRIMADESCYDMEDLLELIELDAVDLINIKLLKSGGLYSSFEMAKVARSAGIEVIVGSMMEGDLGLLNAARLASKISPSAVHDLDAAWWAKRSDLIYQEGSVMF